MNASAAGGVVDTGPSGADDATDLAAEVDQLTDVLLVGHGRVLQAVAEGRPLRDTLELLATVVEEQADGMRASVLLVEDGRLHHGAAPSLPDAYHQAVEGLRAGPEVGSCGTAAHRGELVTVTDVLEDPLWNDLRPLAVEHGFRACWSCPIVGPDGTVTGTVALYDDEPRRPAPHDLAVLRVAARIGAIAIDQQRRQRALVDAETRFRSLFEAAPLGIVHTDDQHRIIEANAAFGSLVRRSPTDLAGASLETLVPAESRAGLRASADAVIATGDVRTLDLQLQRPDRTSSHVHASLSRASRAPAPTAARCVWVVEDITDRVEVDALQRRQRELELAAAHAEKLAGLAQSAVIINSVMSVDEMLGRITEQACGIIGAHMGSTSLTVPGTGRAEGWPQLGISVMLSDRYAEYRSYDAPSHGAATYGLVCENNDVVRMTDEELKNHPLWIGFGEEAGAHPPMRGWLAAPLVAVDGSNLGMLQLSDKFDGDFDEGDESIVIQLAQMASVAVEKASLYEIANEREQARLREELLAGLSHDMQTPLATIAGLVDLLRDDLADAAPDLAQGVGALARQTDHLYALVQQFLDYSRLQADRPLELAARPFDVLRPVRRTIELFADRRRLTLEVSGPVGPALGDVVRAQQVLANVVANAVKFSTDPVEVRIVDEGEAIVVHVDDRGPGLPEPSRPDLVFDRFYRGPNATGTPGTGLGLYVGREVMRALRGDLVAAQRPGGGARFTLRFRAAEERP